MGLESGTRISDLVAANPGGGDGRSIGDNHIRLLKTILKGTAQRLPGMEVISDLTIVGGSITPTAGVHRVDTEGGDPEDDLDTIATTNFLSGAILILVGVTGSRIVTIKHGTGNIDTSGGVDIALATASEALIFRLSGSTWIQVSWIGGALAAGSISANNMFVAGVVDSNAIATDAVGTSEIAANAVKASELNNAAVEQPHLSIEDGDVTSILTAELLTQAGGLYGFWPVLASSTSVGKLQIAAPAVGIEATVTFDTFPANLGIAKINRIVLGTSSGMLTARQRYIQGSPPYNLGNGDIPLFVFARVNTFGKIISSYVAPDPPWANNGPTNTRPDFRRNGKGYKRVRHCSPRPKNPAAMPEWLMARREAPIVEVEVTQELKQADMGLIPHPFDEDNLRDHTVVMIDPVGSFCESLVDLHHEEGVSSLLHKGYIEIDNTHNGAKAPPGVMPVSAKWKGSKCR